MNIKQTLLPINRTLIITNRADSWLWSRSQTWRRFRLWQVGSDGYRNTVTLGHELLDFVLLVWLIVAVIWLTATE